MLYFAQYLLVFTEIGIVMSFDEIIALVFDIAVLNIFSWLFCSC